VSQASRLRLLLIDHERRHVPEECPEELFDLNRQGRIRQRIAHQMHPAIARRLIDSKWNVSRPQARMSALFDVSLRTSKSIDQEIPKALLGAC